VRFSSGNTRVRFSGNNGTFFELGIAAYQFPELEGEPYDSNWVIIAGQAQVNGRAWKFKDPCLLAGEVSDSADWLDAGSKDLLPKAK
jgi:hypothetical protein